MVWLFARFDGRIGRQVYWLAQAFLIAVAALFVRPVVDPETGAVSLHIGNIGLLVLLSAMVSSLAVGAKRLHDFNVSALFAIAYLVPALSILATLVIGLVPGTRGANRFGAAPDMPPDNPGRTPDRDE